MMIDKGKNFRKKLIYRLGWGYIRKNIQKKISQEDS